MNKLSAHSVDVQMDRTLPAARPATLDNRDRAVLNTIGTHSRRTSDMSTRPGLLSDTRPPSTALLQTSPYLTFFRPGQATPIVYAIDELEPAIPDIKPPADAAFGVIGLDRNTVWHTDLTALDALHRAAPAPVARESLTDSYGLDLVSDLIGRRWLQPPDELCVDYLLTTVQIEVTAHCNWGCRYCPVSLDRKPTATMPMPLFEEILEKISCYDTIRYVTFHFYNEPTLDRFFNERVAVLQRHGLRLRLFTNASNLTDDKLEALQQSGVLHQLVVNLPALQEEEFRDLTASKTHARTLRHLESGHRGRPSGRDCSERKRRASPSAACRTAHPLRRTRNLSQVHSDLGSGLQACSR